MAAGSSGSVGAGCKREELASADLLPELEETDKKKATMDFEMPESSPSTDAGNPFVNGKCWWQS